MCIAIDYSSTFDTVRREDMFENSKTKVRNQSEKEGNKVEQTINNNAENLQNILVFFTKRTEKHVLLGYKKTVSLTNRQRISSYSLT